MNLVLSDGGRAAAGYKGTCRDCVCRAIAIAAELPYQEVYNDLREVLKYWPASDRYARRRSPRNGVCTSTTNFHDYMTRLGFRYVSLKGHGLSLRDDAPLPNGRLAVSLKGHYAAVIDNVLHDAYDSRRNRHVDIEGYWIRGE